MFEGHDPYLVTLSIIIAVLGGYTGFGLAARIRGTVGINRRVLLVGAAGFLSVGIWTMHFIGMLAAPLPPDASYLVLPTIVSFLICALVVGVSLFFVSVGKPSSLRVIASAVLLGLGISSMHYVGIHGLAGNFTIRHDLSMVVLSVLIAVAAAYGGLLIYLAPQGGMRLAICAVAFGLAVSGMHYTAMYGMHFVTGAGSGHMADMANGLEASPQILSLIIAFLCFVIAAGFLLLLMPESRSQAEAAAVAGAPAPYLQMDGAMTPLNSAVANFSPATKIPVQTANATHFIDIGEVRSIRADAHYTWVHDGMRERMCSWAISEAEAQLDPVVFSRVHRSYIVAIGHVASLRKEGDGAVIELDGPTPHLVPVSRAKIADLKAMLGLSKRSTLRH